MPQIKFSYTLMLLAFILTIAIGCKEEPSTFNCNVSEWPFSIDTLYVPIVEDGDTILESVVISYGTHQLILDGDTAQSFSVDLARRYSFLKDKYLLICNDEVFLIDTLQTNNFWSTVYHEKFKIVDLSKGEQQHLIDRSPDEYWQVTTTVIEPGRLFKTHFVDRKSGQVSEFTLYINKDSGVYDIETHVHNFDLIYL